MSMWVVASDVWEMVAHGLVWTGTDGFFIVDQMQYLAWIQSASHHLLITNLFVLRPTPSDYFQPAIVISGALAALGVPSWLALLLWKPVAVLATFLAIRAYAYRTVEGRGARRSVIALGLFFGSFSVIYGGFCDRRRHDARLALVGLSVRPDRGGADRLRAAVIRPRPDRRDGSRGRPACSGPWRACSTRGRARR